MKEKSQAYEPNPSHEHEWEDIEGDGCQGRECSICHRTEKLVAYGEADYGWEEVD